MIVNRVADLAFMISLLAIFYTFHDTTFSVMFAMAMYTHTTALFTITILLFIAAMGKSAQLGLHT